MIVEPRSIFRCFFLALQDDELLGVKSGKNTTSWKFHTNLRGKSCSKMFRSGAGVTKLVERGLSWGLFPTQTPILQTTPLDVSNAGAPNIHQQTRCCNHQGHCLRSHPSRHRFHISLCQVTDGRLLPSSQALDPKVVHSPRSGGRHPPVTPRFLGQTDGGMK